MARPQIINRTYVPVKPRIAGERVKTMYVNARLALGLAVVEQGGGYGLGAMFSPYLDDLGEMIVVPLDVPAGSSLIDANRALETLLADLSVPVEEPQD